MLHGRYPPDVQADTASVKPTGGVVLPGDLEVINAPLDRVGMNYYSTTAVRHWTRERPKENADGHGDAR